MVNFEKQLDTLIDLEKALRQRFYEDIGDDLKAEFINGKVFFHPPTKFEEISAIGSLFILLDTFTSINQLGKVLRNKAMIAFPRNDYEPNVVFWKKEKSQHFKKGLWKFPVPDFVAEVLSDSTKKNDRGVKYADYEAQGVEEYWLVEPEEEWVEQYFLKNGKFELHKKTGEGFLRSRAVAGFVIEIDSIFDINANLEALRKMMSA